MTTGSNDSGSGCEDELLSRFFRQVTMRQAARYATTHDTDAGLARFREWLQQHTAPRVTGRAQPVADQAPPLVGQAPPTVSRPDSGQLMPVTEDVGAERIGAGSIVTAIKAAGDAS